MFVRIVIYCVLLALAGCASQAQFAKALNEPAETAKAAQAVAIEAGYDAQRVYYFRGKGVPAVALEERVCTPSRGPAFTASQLGAFGEALETVKKVAAAPDDLTYAGYFAQFRKNAANIRRAYLAPKPVSDNSDGPTPSVDRCIKLFLADANASIGTAPGGFVGGADKIVALDAVIKEIFKVFEKAQRERAVKATVEKLIPELEKVVGYLNAPPAPFTYPYVKYDDEHVAAKKMSLTSLGSTISLRRFMVAKTIIAQEKVIARCSHYDCLGDVNYGQNLNMLVLNMNLYRNLAAVDSDAVLTALAEGVKNAKDANSHGNMTDLLDGLIQIAEAISGINEKYESYKGD